MQQLLTAIFSHNTLHLHTQSNIYSFKFGQPPYTQALKSERIICDYVIILNLQIIVLNLRLLMKKNNLAKKRSLGLMSALAGLWTFFSRGIPKGTCARYTQHCHILKGVTRRLTCSRYGYCWQTSFLLTSASFHYNLSILSPVAKCPQAYDGQWAHAQAHSDCLGPEDLCLTGFTSSFRCKKGTDNNSWLLVVLLAQMTLAGITLNKKCYQQPKR